MFSTNKSTISKKDSMTVKISDGSDLEKGQKDGRRGSSEQSSCYKVILCDVNDELIRVDSSLFFNIAKQICELRRREMKRSAKGCEKQQEPVGILSDADLLAFHRAFSSVQDCHFELAEYLDLLAEDNRGLSKASRYLVKQKSDSNDCSLSQTAAELRKVVAMLERLLADFDHGLVASIVSIGDIINQSKRHAIEDLRGFFDVMEVYGSHIDIELGFSSVEDDLVATEYLLLNCDSADNREFPDLRSDEAKERDRIPTIIELRLHNKYLVSSLKEQVASFNDELQKVQDQSLSFDYRDLLASTRLLLGLLA